MRLNYFSIVVFVLLTGCHLHLVPDGPVYREYPDGSAERSTSVSVYSDSPEDLLRRAQHLASKQQFQKAITLYSDVYRDSSLAAAYREKALFQRASLRTNYFNPNKNFQQALIDFNILLNEFPETEYRLRAEKKIDEIGRARDK